jgi:hypothetical protein
MKRRLWFGLVIFLLFPLLGSAEELRIELGAIHRITSSQDTIETSINLREYMAVELEANEFIKGLEIKVEVPDKILNYRNSFLLTIHSRIRPEPNPERKGYRAVRRYKQPFPQGKRLFIALPIATRERWAPKGPGINLVSSPLPAEEFPIFIGIKPVMKGIPIDVSKTTYPITITPVTIEQGKLVLSSAPAELQEEAELYLDGSSVAASEREFYLSPGVHELRITSPATQPYTRTVVVEKGKTTRQSIELEPAASRISFEAPKDARVYLDGEEIRDHRQAIETEPGEHLVLVRLGDYTMSKKITVRKGENYQVSLFFDILIEKD